MGGQRLFHKRQCSVPIRYEGFRLGLEYANSLLSLLFFSLTETSAYRLLVFIIITCLLYAVLFLYVFTLFYFILYYK